MRVCVRISLVGGVRGALVDSGASNYWPSVTSNYSAAELMHTGFLCACARGFVAHLQLCGADVTSNKFPLVICPAWHLSQSPAGRIPLLLSVSPFDLFTSFGCPMI